MSPQNLLVVIKNRDVEAALGSIPGIDYLVEVGAHPWLRESVVLAKNSLSSTAFPAKQHTWDGA